MDNSDLNERKKKSCLNCPDRHVRIEDGKAVSCRSTCPFYAARSAEREEEYERRLKAWMSESDYQNFKQKSIEKTVRRH